MRNSNWLIALAIAATTTGCVETMNSGYPSGSYGYGNGYSSGYSPGYSGGYYAQPAPTYYSNNYYSSPTRVVTQTRYVPVPVPTPQHHGDRSDDHRWQGSRDDHHGGGTPVVSNHNPAPSPTSTNNSGNHRHGSDQDRDGDGKPDRQR